MAEEPDKDQELDDDSKKRGLYPTGKKKVVTPISVKASAAEKTIKKQSILKKEPETDEDQKAPESAVNSESMSVDDQTESAEKAVEEAATEATRQKDTTPVFVDQGQYHITVPKGKKKRKAKGAKKSAKKSVVFIVLAFITVVLVAAYLMFFGIEEGVILEIVEGIL